MGLFFSSKMKHAYHRRTQNKDFYDTLHVHFETIKTVLVQSTHEHTPKKKTEQQKHIFFYFTCI